MEIEKEKLYTTREAASALGISEITAKRHVLKGVIPSIKIGGARRIRGRDLPLFVHVDRKPFGGCELIYPTKKNGGEIIETAPQGIFKQSYIHGNGRNGHIIQGDNLKALGNLVRDPQIRGKVDLIYIDPPFGTGQNFVGYDNQSYSDKLVKSEFLEFLRIRLVLLKEILAETGSIYVHIDTKIGHYVKVLMDEIFGEENFRNEITRIKCNPKNFDRKAFGNIKDVIFFYSKSGTDSLNWSDFRIPLTEDEITKQFPKIDPSGRRYATTPLHAKGETRNGPTGGIWKGLLPPKGRHWRYAPSELTRLDEAGLIEWSSKGNPRKIIYAHENAGKKIQDIWDFKDPGFEKSLYPTEKNIDLLKQIISVSSKPGDLVLDCFSGSGTTLIAAEQLGRRWVGIDQNPDAIRTVKKRFLEMSGNSNRSGFTISEVI